MNQPASAPGTPPPHAPQPDSQDKREGTNETLHHPDDRARQHPAREDRKPRSPYVTGNT